MQTTYGVPSTDTLPIRQHRRIWQLCLRSIPNSAPMTANSVISEPMPDQNRYQYPEPLSSPRMCASISAEHHHAVSNGRVDGKSQNDRVGCCRLCIHHDQVAAVVEYLHDDIGGAEVVGNRV